MNHKRKRSKNTRRGCLMRKPNKDGFGNLEGDGTLLTWTPYGGSAGSYVVVSADGTSFVLDRKTHAPVIPGWNNERFRE